ncbi:uncharacterized protein [Struthio camelus]|uniref:uncharacterized protein n=1 Tax=Struthio camelus TaxID=8801 RepID=UPI003604048B
MPPPADTESARAPGPRGRRLLPPFAAAAVGAAALGAAAAAATLLALLRVPPAPQVSVQVSVWMSVGVSVHPSGCPSVQVYIQASICLGVHKCVRPHVHPSECSSECLFIQLSSHLGVCLGVCLFRCLSTYLSIWESIYLSAWVSVWVYIHLGVHLATQLSVCLSIWGGSVCPSGGPSICAFRCPSLPLPVYPSGGLCAHPEGTHLSTGPGLSPGSKGFLSVWCAPCHASVSPSLKGVNDLPPHPGSAVGTPQNPLQELWKVPKSQAKNLRQLQTSPLPTPGWGDGTRDAWTLPADTHSPLAQGATAAHVLLSAGSLVVPSQLAWRYEEGISGVFISGDVQPAAQGLRVDAGGLYLLYGQFALTCTEAPCPAGAVTLQVLRAGSTRPLLAVPLALTPGLEPARSGLTQAVGHLQAGDVLSLALAGKLPGDSWQLAQDDREGNFVGMIRIATD